MKHRIAPAVRTAAAAAVGALPLAATLLALGAAAAASGPALAQSYSTPVDLGTLGGTHVNAFDINGGGQVVGQSTFSGDGSARGFISSSSAAGGAMTALLPLKGGVHSLARSVNNSAQAVGYSKASTYRTAVIWNAASSTGNKAISLGLLKNGYESDAWGINARGQVVGYCRVNSVRTSIGKAILWQPSSPNAATGTLYDLGEGSVMGINDAGVIIGGFAGYGPSVRFPSTPNGTAYGTPISVGYLRPSDPTLRYTELTDINDADPVTGRPVQVVGWSAVNDYPEIAIQDGTDGQYRAILWSPGMAGPLNLGTLPGGYESFAYGVNNKGQVVGWADINESNGMPAGHYPSRKWRAFLWKDDNGNGVSDPGEMKDLNSLIPAGTGWDLTEARSINDNGQVTGIGTLNGVKKAFIISLPAIP